MDVVSGNFSFSKLGNMFTKTNILFVRMGIIEPRIHFQDFICEK